MISPFILWLDFCQLYSSFEYYKQKLKLKL